MAKTFTVTLSDKQAECVDIYARNNGQVDAPTCIQHKISQLGDQCTRHCCEKGLREYGVNSLNDLTDAEVASLKAARVRTVQAP